MNLPADVARCMVNLCIRREECARAVPPPQEWERVVWATFPDEGCKHFIERDE